MALSMLTMATELALPQAAPPSLGVQSPAQQAAPVQSPPQQIEPQPSAPPAREENPGLFNEIGKLFEKSKSMLPPLKSPSETFDDLNARARDAGESLSNFAKPSTMVSGRAACVVATNGALDCKAGAEKLCQSKGFKEGKSLRCRRKMLADRVPAGAQARPQRLQDRKFRDAGFVPVA
jgi:hypothetical protein